jgi:hypothetical protein
LYSRCGWRCVAFAGSGRSPVLFSVYISCGEEEEEGVLHTTYLLPLHFFCVLPIGSSGLR